METFDDRPGMDLFEAIGNRRSIRYFLPHRPVERWKIEMMLHAAQHASRAANSQFLKAVVVERDSLDQETRDALKTPTNTAFLDMAPIYVFTFADLGAMEGAADRLKHLFDRGALSVGLGFSHRYFDEVVIGSFLGPLLSDETTRIAAACTEAGMALANLLSTGVALGLGVCVTVGNMAPVLERLKVPDACRPLYVVLVGYPAENPKAEGQRPREPLGDDFGWGDFETPFQATREVVDELRRRKLIQETGPFPWRQEELRWLARAFGLPEE